MLVSAIEKLPPGLPGARIPNDLRALPPGLPGARIDLTALPPGLPGARPGMSPVDVSGLPPGLPGARPYLEPTDVSGLEGLEALGIFTPLSPLINLIKGQDVQAIQAGYREDAAITGILLLVAAGFNVLWAIAFFRALGREPNNFWKVVNGAGGALSALGVLANVGIGIAAIAGGI